MKQLYMCIAGGGTGGHIMPALTLADAVRQEHPHLNVEFIGTDYGLEARLLPQRGEKVFLLKMRAIQGKSLLHKLWVYGIALPIAVLQVCWIWRKQRPCVVVGVGGYASVAAVLAAVLWRVPIVLYEQNAIPGMVNRRLAPWCQSMMLGFPQAKDFLPNIPCVDTGNIVANSLKNKTKTSHKTPCLIVLGGSQGAMFLNDNIPKACKILAEEGLTFHVLHQCGSRTGTLEQVRQAYATAQVEAEVIDFCTNMPDFYAQGDLLVARSGAMTVSEAAMQALASIFIPYPYAADDHQYFNAQAMADAQAAIVLREEDISIEQLAAQLKKILFAPEQLRKMSQAAKSVAPVEATTRQLQVLAAYIPSKNTEGTQ